MPPDLAWLVRVRVSKNLSNLEKPLTSAKPENFLLQGLSILLALDTVGYTRHQTDLHGGYR